MALLDSHMKENPPRYASSGAKRIIHHVRWQHLLLIVDNLAGHYSRDLVNWCYERGIGLLYTPCAGSWLNMAESVQRIILRRALWEHHVYDVEILKDWLRDTIEGWNRHPTPFILAGKRHARRDRA